MRRARVRRQRVVWGEGVTDGLGRSWMDGVASGLSKRLRKKYKEYYEDREESGR